MARRSDLATGTLDARLRIVYRDHFLGTNRTGYCDTFEDWLAEGAPLLLDGSHEEIATVEEYRATR